MATASARPPDGPSRRLALAAALLAVTWGAAFAVTDLPYLPLVATGGLVTGLAGVWVRRAPAGVALPRLRLGSGDLAVAVGAGALHLVATHALAAAVATLAPGLVPTAEEAFGPIVWWAVLLAGVVTAPLSELFWRGGAQPLLADLLRRRSRGGPGGLVAVAVGAVAYAAFHAVTGQPSLVAAALLGGLVWGWLLERTGSVGACMVAHALWATGVLLAPPL